AAFALALAFLALGSCGDDGNSGPASGLDPESLIIGCVRTAACGIHPRARVADCINSYNDRTVSFGLAPVVDPIFRCANKATGCTAIAACFGAEDTCDRSFSARCDGKQAIFCDLIDDRVYSYDCGAASLDCAIDDGNPFAATCTGGGSPSGGLRRTPSCLQDRCRKTAEDVPISNLVDSVFRKNDRIKQYTQRPKDTLQDNKIEDDVSKTKVKRDKVFISYSHKNKKWFKKVRTHLKVLESEGISVNFWADTEIKSGSKWREDIANGLSTAKVAILLVSTEFLASDFINKEEIPKLLKAAESDGATILPLILKPCRFIKNKKLSEFQAINDPAKPLSGLSKNKQEKILVQMTDRIAELISPEEN
ncbi:MAG: toll/interleukin-1 receptor domain-containing protein, partial [candidate division Zixibacteria bacterium]|nr:toll/interleukin-1 receptor domain-containing protein [candidate division Zixibacteria bacterium]